MKLDGFFETSAKNGQNVELAFIDAAKKLYLMNTPDGGDEDPSKLNPLVHKRTSTLANSSALPTKLMKDKHDSNSDKEQVKKKKKQWC